MIGHPTSQGEPDMTWSACVTPTVRALVLTALISCARAQQPTEPPQPAMPPSVTSPVVGEDGRITFRLFAPAATAVRVSSGDMLGFGPGAGMEKNAEGIWEATVGPVGPGAYRYTFSIDGVTVVDPANAATSETNSGVQSLVVVPGSDVMDARDVPHGAVAEVFYQSKSLGRLRRMHVYTPPGYERSEEQYPVLYLLHGAFDCDDAWTTVGRAGFILDNLIAAGKAKPMVVVMPAGHTGPFQFGPSFGADLGKQIGEFASDFLMDIKPYIESHYRIEADQAHRAIAGLSMGGLQTLNIAIPYLADYGYIGVFSSGIFGRQGAATDTAWEERNKGALDNAEAKQGLRLVWFSTGKDDFLLRTSTATVDMLRKHGFEVTYEESEGGHTWANWRDYLAKFAPLLFGD